MRLPSLVFLLLLAAACRTSDPALPSLPAEEVHALMQRPDVVRAMDFVERDRETIVAQWRELTEIPAPSGHEARRAEYVETLLRTYGLQDVRRDAAGNVLATRRGSGGGKRVVFDAHLDTVFPLGTDLTTRIENGRIHGPGAGDNTRNVVALLAVIRAMNEAAVETNGDVTFLFSVEEETSFDGIDHFLADRAGSVDGFVALDGGYGGFTYGGTGIYWHRYHILGPGGHTRSRTPPYSATLPLARAIERLYALDVPPTSWLNVGMLGGADVFNAKAADAWMSVDLRSTVPEELHRLDAQIHSIVSEEAERAGMTMRRDVVSTSEVATLPGHRHSEMVLTTEAVYRAFGDDPEITSAASNHSSVALRAGVPAISTGTAPCRGAHSVGESCEIEPIFHGIRRTIVLAVALSE